MIFSKSLNLLIKLLKVIENGLNNFSKSITLLMKLLKVIENFFNNFSKSAKFLIKLLIFSMFFKSADDSVTGRQHPHFLY